MPRARSCANSATSRKSSSKSAIANSSIQQSIVSLLFNNANHSPGPAMGSSCRLPCPSPRGNRLPFKPASGSSRSSRHSVWPLGNNAAAERKFKPACNTKSPNKSPSAAAFCGTPATTNPAGRGASSAALAPGCHRAIWRSFISTAAVPQRFKRLQIGAIAKAESLNRLPNTTLQQTPLQHSPASQGNSQPTAAWIDANPWRSNCCCNPAKIHGTNSGPR